MLASAASWLLTAAMGLAAPAQCGVPGSDGNPVGARVVDHLGGAAISCGRLWCQPSRRIEPGPDQIAELRACVEQAYRAGRSFYFSIEQHGADAYVATGLMRRGSGPLQRFWFDSNPSPTGGRGSHFVVAECPSPDAPGRVDPFVECPRGTRSPPGAR
jgi:hypothetical protein